MRPKSPGCRNQSQVAFVNQIEQWKAETAELLGVVHNKSEIRLDQAADSFFVAVQLYPPRELPLVVERQRREAGDFTKVGMQRWRFECKRLELPHHQRILPLVRRSCAA